MNTLLKIFCGFLTWMAFSTILAILAATDVNVINNTQGMITCVITLFMWAFWSGRLIKRSEATK